MWDSVGDNFMGFSEPLEGKVPFMYQDTLGKVTIGIGNLIDSEEAAVALPGIGVEFFHEEAPGTPLTRAASEGEIRTEWRRIKSDPTLAAGGWRAAEPLTDLRLSHEGIATLVSAKVLEIEAHLTNGHIAEFSGFASWPADAQLGLLSMSWAMGAAFADGGKWPSFRAGCAIEDWLEAAKNCNMGNSWLAKRNAVNRGLFRNAAVSAAPPPDDPATLLLPVPGARPTLRLGARDDGADDSVNVLQQFLEWMGYTVVPSGDFDQATDSAVRAFQSDEMSLPGATGFTSDGVVGPLTWAALGFLVP
jgi:hypothetical protein